MVLLEPNSNLSIRLSLTALKLAGFWSPDGWSGRARLAYRCYAIASFMFLLGTYLAIQVVDLYLVWGDLAAMTGTAFLLFTNLAQTAKIANLVRRRSALADLVRESDGTLRAARGPEASAVVRRCDRETSRDQLLFFALTTVTVSGWASSAEGDDLPLRAWYPYDTRKSPAYELTYTHQVVAIFLAAYLNVAKDTLVTALVAQTRCRLRLLRLALRDVTAHAHDPQRPHRHLPGDEPFKFSLLNESEEREARRRLRACVVHHQAALAAAAEIENCFKMPTFAQLTVSLIIICVTAFQMASLKGNAVRVLSMATYLLNMVYQVFLYCRHGNNLREESASVPTAAYECSWYRCSASFRSTLLILSRRCVKPLRLTAGGFTALSLETFMALIKASYSFFTVLQQVQEDTK